MVTDQKNELKLTKTLAGAAGLLAVVALVTAPRNITPSAFLDQGELFFPTFQDPNEAMTLEVIEFDEDTGSARPFKVQNDEGRWTIPSHHNYVADGEERLSQTAAGVITITKDDFRSDNVSDHEVLGVLDPLDETETGLTGRGKRITLKGSNDVVLADLIVGSEVEDRENYHFVRVPTQKRVYAAKIDVEISTKFEDWIEQDLLAAEQSSINKIVLMDYSIDERTYRVNQNDTFTLTKESEEWKADRLRAAQELDTTKLDDFLKEISELAIVGVRPKPEGIDARLSGMTVSQSDVLSLQSRGYYLTRSGDLLSNEGELQIRSNDGISYTLRFGEILYGTGEAISAGTDSANDSEIGPGENRYLFITASFDSTTFSEPPKPANYDFEDKQDTDLTDMDKENKRVADEHKRWQENIKEGEEKTAQLTSRFQPWYYVISASSFDKIRLRRTDLIKTKEATATE